MEFVNKMVWSDLMLSTCQMAMSHKHLKSLCTKRRELFLLSRWISKKSNVQHIDSRKTLAVDITPSKCTSFEEMVDGRRLEARRSIVVQVQSAHSCSELYSYCSLYGSVKTMHHYTLSGPSHYFLVEFEKVTDVDHILNNSGHLDTNQIVPVRSPFLWFRLGKCKTKKEDLGEVSNIPLVETDGNNSPTKHDLCNWMHEAECVSDQICVLHEATTLTSLGTRLRFLTALQIEQALSGPFPRIRAYPFGSSVNGFGRVNCDLDLVLVLDNEEANSDCRLIFHAKNSLTNGRTQVQRHMETIGDMCQLFLPGCANVRRILQARVPIIKYRQELTGVECDLSMTNMSAVYMSELLFILGSLDKRVRPLVLAIRTWARDVGLTNSSPGRWITNFSLTLLVLFFLQQSNPHPVLPTLNKMKSLATNADKRVTTEGVNCTFVRDLSKLLTFMQSQPKNTDKLEDLLLKFFEFFCTFDFSTSAISLGTGIAIPKPEHAALYIVNPLERGLNVSKNVSLEELERLRIEFRNAAWALEANLKQPLDKSTLWGLVAICQAPKLQAKGQNIFYIPPRSTDKLRRFNIQDLFEEDVHVEEKEPSVVDTTLSSTQSMPDKSQEMRPTKKETHSEQIVLDVKAMRPYRRKKR